MHTYLFQESGEENIPYFLWRKGHHDGNVPTLFQHQCHLLSSGKFSYRKI